MSVAQHEAAGHQAAAAALVDSEARACAGLSSEDRSTNPFDRIDDIAAVTPLVENTSSKFRQQRTAGALITVRARPGMTAEWLQRVVDCHLAHTATLDVADMPNCPLVPRGAVARVTSTGNGFAFAVRSDNADTAREILDRAQRLWAERSAPR